MTTSGANKMNYITKRPSHVLRLDAEIAKKASKYGNRKTWCTFGRKESASHLHDSKREADRCNELRLLEKGGEIVCLEFQPEFPLIVNRILVCKYRADFGYYDARTNKRVVEDSKGFKTAVYRIKKKLMKACWQVEITET